MSTNYFVLSDPGTKKNLVIRMADPALHIPQSVAIYNPLSVSAFVQTDHKSNMNEDAFLLLLKMIKYDFDQYMSSSQTWYPYPKYLLRYNNFPIFSLQNFLLQVTKSLEAVEKEVTLVTWTD